jgi:hypothetical protein
MECALRLVDPSSPLDEPIFGVGTRLLRRYTAAAEFCRIETYRINQRFTDVILTIR